MDTYILMYILYILCNCCNTAYIITEISLVLPWRFCILNYLTQYWHYWHSSTNECVVVGKMFSNSFGKSSNAQSSGWLLYLQLFGIDFSVIESSLSVLAYCTLTNWSELAPWRPCKPCSTNLELFLDSLSYSIWERIEVRKRKGGFFRPCRWRQIKL